MSENQKVSVTVFSINEEDVSEKDFLENVVEKDFLSHDKIDAEESEVKVNVMEKVLSVAAVNFDFVDSKLNFALVISAFEPVQSKAKIKQKSKRGRKSKDDKFAALLSLLNVHIDLHLADNAREYATIMNFNVFAEKMKHM